MNWRDRIQYRGTHFTDAACVQHMSHCTSQISNWTEINGVIHPHIHTSSKASTQV